MSVAKMQKRDFLKNWATYSYGVVLTTNRKSYMGFSDNPFFDPTMTLIDVVAYCMDDSPMHNQASHATARNSACQWGKNSWQCAWGCVAMRVRWSSACRATSLRNFWNVQNFISKVSRLVTTTLLSAHAWHWVSRISWTFRNLCVTDGTICGAGHCGNNIRASVRLASCYRLDYATLVT